MKRFVLSFSTSHYGEPTTFGECIRKARLEKGLRQKDVAEAIEVDEMTIVNWERYETVPQRIHSKFDSLWSILSIDKSYLKEAFPHRGSLWKS